LAARAKKTSVRDQNREATREAVLDAAERLLEESPSAEFSMRELADEAGVSFATPFNHFGTKTAIMQALSSRVIARMAELFQKEHAKGDAIDGVLAMARISVNVLLEKPAVSKAVVGSLGVVSSVPSAVKPQSEALWRLSLGEMPGIEPSATALAATLLPQQLAFAFRGCASFWIAGELSDHKFRQAFRTSALTALLGFAKQSRRAWIVAQLASSRTPTS
jgi:AcrR family transcriptional regulator